MALASSTVYYQSRTHNAVRGSTCPLVRRSLGPSFHDARVKKCDDAHFHPFPAAPRYLFSKITFPSTFSKELCHVTKEQCSSHACMRVAGLRGIHAIFQQQGEAFSAQKWNNENLARLLPSIIFNLREGKFELPNISLKKSESER